MIGNTGMDSHEFTYDLFCHLESSWCNKNIYIFWLNMNISIQFQFQLQLYVLIGMAKHITM